MSQQALRCGWCDKLLRQGTQPESTGICPVCVGGVDTDIDRIAERVWLAGKPDEQRRAWAEAQNLSRLRARAQNAADFDSGTTTVGPGFFIPLPPSPVRPRHRIDPVRVLCYAGAALLMVIVWFNVVRWAL